MTEPHSTMINMHVLTVGSSLVDIFLKPNNENVKQSETQVTLNLGDKIPTELVSISVGGNAPNVAIALKKLGINSSLYTHLGDNFFSKEIENKINEEKVNLLKDVKKGANASFSLITSFKDDRIIFAHHEARDHDFNYPSDAQKPDVIYLTSIGKVWERAYQKTIEFAKTNDSVLALSPGSHQMHNINDILVETIKHSTIFFSNKEEAEAIVQATNEKTAEIKTLFKHLHSLGPKIISITDGENGAYASDGEKITHIKKQTVECVERTGAGDSYAAGFLASYLKTKDTAQSMKWGTVNASNAIQHIGAHNGLLTESQITKQLEKTGLEVTNI